MSNKIETITSDDDINQHTSEIELKQASNKQEYSILLDQSNEKNKIDEDKSYIKPKVEQKSADNKQGLTLKIVLLVVLVFYQTAALQIIKLGKIVLNEKKEIYISSTVIWAIEVAKFLFAFLIAFNEHNLFEILQLVFGYQYRYDLLNLCVPASLYAIQNNLIFYGIENLDPVNYKILTNIRILTTAGFAVLILSQKLSRQQWICVFVLCIGVILVQHESSQTTNKYQQHPILGFISVIIASFTSGFASVYFEKILKAKDAGKPPVNFWIQQIRLAFCQIFFTAVCMYIQDYQEIQDKGVFYGYNHFTIFVIITQAFGGMLMGLVIKYADNILKSFAASVTVVFTYVLSYIIFGTPLNAVVVFGSYIVILSVFFYSVKVEECYKNGKIQMFLITLTIGSAYVIFTHI